MGRDPFMGPFFYTTIHSVVWLVFDGTDDNMDSNAFAPFSGEMSFFFVSRTNQSATSSQIIFSMNRNDSIVFTVGYKLSSIIVSSVVFGNQLTNSIAVPDGVDEWNIAYCQLKENTPTDYSIIISINGGTESNLSGVLQNGDYTTAGFQIGCTQQGGTNGNFLNGNLSEVIGYNKAINSDEKSQVLNYLNNKYKIY